MHGDTVEVEVSCGYCGYDQFVCVNPLLEEETATCQKCGKVFWMTLEVIAEGFEMGDEAETVSAAEGK